MTEHKNLAEALAAFQGEVPTLRKDATNPHFRSKYTPLDTIVETVTPLLVKHGLTWSTFPCRDTQGEPALRYKLTHISSGEVEQDVMPLMIVKADPQGLGSALTYARRYSLSAVLNLVSDEDDDGNAGSRPRGGTTRQPTAAPVQQTERLANAGQRGKINAKAAEAKLPASMLANIVLMSNGADSREFASEDAAQEWLKRGLDRLPASKVDMVLKNIAAEAMP